jgi:hypothetical protein
VLRASLMRTFGERRMTPGLGATPREPNSLPPAYAPKLAPPRRRGPADRPGTPQPTATAGTRQRPTLGNADSSRSCPPPAHAVIVFTTTTEGQEALFEDYDDASPLLSRCLRLDLARRDLARPFAERCKAIAEAKGLDGQPIERYVRHAVVKRMKGACLGAVCNWAATEDGAASQVILPLADVPVTLPSMEPKVAGSNPAGCTPSPQSIRAANGLKPTH